MGYALLFLILIGYMIYGIVSVIKNKQLNRAEKTVWIAVIVFLPVLGASMYLRGTFVARH